MLAAPMTTASEQSSTRRPLHHGPATQPGRSLPPTVNRQHALRLPGHLEVLGGGDHHHGHPCGSGADDSVGGRHLVRLLFEGQAEVVEPSDDVGTQQQRRSPRHLRSSRAGPCHLRWPPWHRFRGRGGARTRRRRARPGRPRHRVPRARLADRHSCPTDPFRPESCSSASPSSWTVSSPCCSNHTSKPGSTDPGRVPMTSPSVGVNPMVVSTERPPTTAANEAPLPTWQETTRNDSRGCPTSLAACRTA